MLRMERKVFTIVFYSVISASFDNLVFMKYLTEA